MSTIVSISRRKLILIAIFGGIGAVSQAYQLVHGERSFFVISLFVAFLLVIAAGLWALYK
jgi:hypothetical protein